MAAIAESVRSDDASHGYHEDQGKHGQTAGITFVRVPILNQAENPETCNCEGQEVTHASAVHANFSSAVLTAHRSPSLSSTVLQSLPAAISLATWNKICYEPATTQTRSAPGVGFRQQLAASS